MPPGSPAPSDAPVTLDCLVHISPPVPSDSDAIRFSGAIRFRCRPISHMPDPIRFRFDSKCLPMMFRYSIFRSDSISIKGSCRYHPIPMPSDLCISGEIRFRYHPICIRYPVNADQKIDRQGHGIIEQRIIKKNHLEKKHLRGIWEASRGI